MKKLLSTVAIILTTVMLLTVAPVFADNGDVEISFKVGDSTLMINGVAKTVETPYVVGTGTTLVPVRVITEAFGAKVDWDNDTRTAILEYEGIKILLQIGNITAEVNGKAQTLLAAPELTNGSTMVPLRFISETFNATVDYEPETEAITVVKKASAEGTTLEGAVDSKNIGDSYFGWVMEKPADMQMDYRAFDGTYTSFMYDDNNYIYIDIFSADTEYDLDEDFKEAKESVEGLTLIKAEKYSDTNYSKIHIQAKNQIGFHDIQRYVTAKYSIIVYGNFQNEDTKKRDQWIETLKTFKPSYNGTETYDLSNVKNDVRRYEVKDAKISFDVPKEFYVISSDYAINEFHFASVEPNDYSSDLNVGIYSKSDVKSAKALAEKDYTNNKEALTSPVMTFSNGVTTKKYTNFDAYEYSYEYNTSVIKAISKDVFFELGDYVYNVSITLDSKIYPDNKALAEKIINSVQVEMLDANEVGILMRNDPDTSGTYEAEAAGFKLTLPKVYTEVQTGGYQNKRNGIVIAFAGNKLKPITDAEAKEYVKNYENAYKDEEDCTILNSTGETTINGKKYFTLTLRQTDDTGYVYTELYMNSTHSFAVIYPEIAYSQKSIESVKKIIATLK